MSESTSSVSGASAAASAAARNVVDVPSIPSLADRLKEATAEQHRRAETGTLMSSLAAGTIERPAYTRWLAAMHGLHGALQAAIEIAVTSEAARDGGRGSAFAQLTSGHPRHLEHLQADAKALAADPGATADSAATLSDDATPRAETAARDLAEIASTEPIAVLGSLYVLEGSMNGNSYIARRLAGVWGTDTGLTYLQSDGPDQRPNWMQWRDGLDAIEMSAAEQDATVAAAGRMFDAVGELCDEVESAARAAN